MQIGLDPTIRQTVVQIFNKQGINGLIGIIYIMIKNTQDFIAVTFRWWQEIFRLAAYNSQSTRN